MPHKPGQCCVQVWISACERRWTRAVSPCQWELVSWYQRVLAVAKLDTRRRDVDSAMRSAAIVARLDISRQCADNVRNLLASQVPRAAVARVLAKAARAVETQTRAIVVDRSVTDELIVLAETKDCSLCCKRGHLLSQVYRSSGGNASARAVEADPAEPEEDREIQHVWALSVCDNSDLLSDALSVCHNSDIPSDDSGNLLNMIMDSGAEERVVSLADWRSPGEPLLKPAQVRLRSATGDNMGVSGSFVVRGWCDHKMVEMTTLVATRATRSLCSAMKLVSAGYSIEMRPALASQWRRLHTAPALRYA